MLYNEDIQEEFDMQTQYIKDANPKIIANKCPWCDNEIRRVDHDEDED